MPLQGHSGSAVCRQAAEHLTLWLCQWRTESALGEVAERHIKLTVKLLSAYTVLVNTKGSGDLPPSVFILVVGVRIFIVFKWNLKKILKLNFFTKYLTPFYRGFIPSGASQISKLVSCVSGGFFYIVLISTHQGTEFSVCICHSFLSDEMTSSSYLLTPS